ncbi:MAG: hypothetical protein ACP5JJ_16255 [Anaerolineae bacterium]
MSVAWLIERYTQTWWQVDRAYRRFRAGMDRGVSHLDAALKWPRRIYQDFLEAVNARFGNGLVGLPLPGSLSRSQKRGIVPFALDNRKDQRICSPLPGLEEGLGVRADCTLIHK